MLAQKLLGAMAGGGETLYVDDCFATVTRTGTGASATITTGFQPDLVWCKQRNGSGFHELFDSARGVTKYLSTNTTSAQTTNANTLTAFNSTGYTIGSDGEINTNASTYVDWVFAKKAKFFDCGTYTGNGVAGRQISHALGVAPGMVIVKQISGPYGGQWWVYHRSLGSGSEIQLQSTAAKTNYAEFGADPTATYFTVSSDGGVNGAGASYVWYAFAHDISAEGIIQCGSAVVSGGAINVTLNWEPQYVLLKASSAVGNWQIYDTMRGWNNSTASTDEYLLPNSSGAAATTDAGNPTATGFTVNGLPNGDTYIYLAIRRPNKPPTTGTQVYNAIARTGTGAAATVTGVGFAPDISITKFRTGTSDWWNWYDRMRGKDLQLSSNATNAEINNTNLGASFDLMDGIRFGGSDSANNGSGNTYINHFFRRAPGVFDVVAYTGTGSATTVAHNLGVPPELMIVKRRDGVSSWVVYTSTTGATHRLFLDSTAAAGLSSVVWNDTAPTTSVFTVGSAISVSPATYTAYLWATKAGISKVGTYTGNGSSQTIDCGFTTGCRFFMVKATSTTGSWWIFDSVRGVISAADPALQLNSTAAEVTSADAVDPASSGIIVNQEATCSINANGVSYIYLALS